MDFPRDMDGKLETDDYYIPCRNGAMIYHYGKDVLEVFIPSIMKGRNLLSMCDENNIKTFHIIEGDGELSFRFKAKYIDFIASYLKAKTAGKNVRPFSSKNLPKADYHIPEENIKEYKEITDEIPKDKVLVISNIIDMFLSEIMQKKYRDIDIKKDIKDKCMVRQKKEYIHSMGEWDNFLSYFKKEISNRLEKINE